MPRGNVVAKPLYHAAFVPGLLLWLAAAAAAGGNTPKFGATLHVDDPNSTGSVGDALLSLSEAILLSGGLLSLPALSADELARIEGEPGATSSDLIRVELGEGAVLTTPAGETFGLPVLFGNDGDVFDGRGAILRPEGALPPGAFGLVSVSSRIEIRGFSFEGYPFGIILLATPGADDLENIQIKRNRFSGYDNALVVLPNAGGSKGLRGLRIERNRFVALGSEPNGAIIVLGALPETPGAVSSDYVVEDVVIRKNEVEGGFGAIAVFGGQSRPGTIVRNGRVRGVRVLENEIRNVFDVSIAIHAGFAFLGGEVSGVEVSDVRVAENHITSAGLPSSHIWVVSGSAVGEPGGLAENNVLRDLTLVGNETSGAGDCVLGIQLQASQNEVGGGVARGNVLQRARIFANSVSGCGNGVALFGGVAAAGRGLVEANELRKVRIFGNHLADNRSNVIVAGAVGVEGSALPLPSPEPATLQDNVVHSVEVSGNRIRGGVNGIVAFGGISNATSDVVTFNSVSNAKAFGNSVRGSEFGCRAVDDFVLGDEGGVAADNHAELACGKRDLH